MIAQSYIAVLVFFLVHHNKCCLKAVIEMDQSQFCNFYYK